MAASEIRKLSGFDQIRSARSFKAAADQRDRGALGDLVITIDGLGDLQEASPADRARSAQAQRQLQRLRRR